MTCVSEAEIEAIIAKVEARGISAIYAHESTKVQRFCGAHPEHPLTKRWIATMDPDVICT